MLFFFPNCLLKVWCKFWFQDAGAIRHFKHKCYTFVALINVIYKRNIHGSVWFKITYYLWVCWFEWRIYVYIWLLTKLKYILYGLPKHKGFTGTLYMLCWVAFYHGRANLLHGKHVRGIQTAYSFSNPYAKAYKCNVRDYLKVFYTHTHQHMPLWRW